MTDTSPDTSRHQLSRILYNTYLVCNELILLRPYLIREFEDFNQSYFDKMSIDRLKDEAESFLHAINLAIKQYETGEFFFEQYERLNEHNYNTIKLFRNDILHSLDN